MQIFSVAVPYKVVEIDKVIVMELEHGASIVFVINQISWLAWFFLRIICFATDSCIP